MKYPVNNNIFNNTENKYEEKPKINDVLKNQKKQLIQEKIKIISKKSILRIIKI